ncbi:hypothetical protein POM88_047731 [Heracleum sosnowskyi]|uniref:Small ribosomal subunit protein eS4 N-terminal domain-containing protein n=1 Tax=Heracleum sosnowskyi TaxID=360622 RepID=A0AAD8GUQ7_9APIA|nr:hypothetical protein POM88_047731 [Heracleum sosnowskyi]
MVEAIIPHLGKRIEDSFEEAQSPKALDAPKHWMLDKLGGTFAPKPSSGPHKSRECLPLILILRNKLKYALTYREVQSILMQRHVLVDGKFRTDKTYRIGFMVGGFSSGTVIVW